MYRRLTDRSSHPNADVGWFWDIQRTEATDWRVRVNHEPGDTAEDGCATVGHRADYCKGP
jgi:hypothetical protein